MTRVVAAVAAAPGAGGCRATRGRGQRRQVGPRRQLLGAAVAWCGKAGPARCARLGWRGWAASAKLGRGKKNGHGPFERKGRNGRKFPFFL